MIFCETTSGDNWITGALSKRHYIHIDTVIPPRFRVFPLTLHPSFSLSRRRRLEWMQLVVAQRKLPARIYVYVQCVVWYRRQERESESIYTEQRMQALHIKPSRERGKSKKKRVISVASASTSHWKWPAGGVSFHLAWNVLFYDEVIENYKAS